MRLTADWRGVLHLGRMSSAYFATTVINQAIPFLLLPVLTRYLNPAAYANIALFGLFLALSNSLAGVSVHAVISKNHFELPRRELSRVIGDAITVVALLSSLVILLFAGLRGLFGAALGMPLVWLLLTPVASFFFIVFQMGLNVLRNENRVLAFSLQQIGNTLMNALASLLLVVGLWLGWQGRVWGIVISLAASAAWSFARMRRDGFVRFAVRRGGMRDVLRVVLPLIPNSFQSVVIAQAGILIILQYFGKETLGVYSVAFQIALAVKLLVETLGLSWSPFLYGQLSKPGEVNRMYVTRLLYGHIGIVFAGLVLLNLFSGPILKVMTAPAFRDARQFIPWLTLGFFFQGIHAFLFPILIKFERQRFISLVSLAHMGLLVALTVGMMKPFGPIGVVYAFCLTYFTMFLAFAWKSQRVFPMPLLRALKIWG